MSLDVCDLIDGKKLALTQKQRKDAWAWFNNFCVCVQIYTHEVEETDLQQRS